jgi:hypothetical protein
MANQATNRAGAAGQIGYGLVTYYQPAITAADSPIVNGDTGKTVGGTDFPTSATGSAKLELGSASDYTGTKVTQTVTSWGSTSLTYTVVQGALSAGTVYAFVTNADGNRNATGYGTTLNEPTIPNGYGVPALTLSTTGAGAKTTYGYGVPALSLGTTGEGKKVSYSATAVASLTLDTTGVGQSVHYGSGSVALTTLGTTGEGISPDIPFTYTALTTRIRRFNAATYRRM